LHAFIVHLNASDSVYAGAPSTCWVESKKREGRRRNKEEGRGWKS